MPDDDLALAADFPPADRAAWEALAAKAIRGASLDRLVRRTRDGLAIRPVYSRPATLAPPCFSRAGDGTGGWDLRQRHAQPDPAVANPAILDDLECGAASIALRLDRVLSAGGNAAPDGLVALDAADLGRASDGVYLDLAPVALEGGGAAAAALLLAVLDRRGPGVPVAAGTALGVDPLGDALCGVPADPAAALTLAGKLARHAAACRRPGLSILLADGRPWHAAGASEAQELAYALAAAVYYLRVLEAAGLEVGAAAGQVAFALAADADLFLTTAKLRALRLLWRRVLAASGVANAAALLRLHAETATRMYARRDPWVNVLRGTVACFAAVAGGADSVTVLPLDHALGLPSPQARRLARSTQLVLMEESNLRRVADPAGGGWYVEELTRELATRAWGLFREVEAGGGMLAALRAGDPQARVAGNWAERARDLAARKEPVTGVSEFPDLDERPPPAPEPFDSAPLVERVHKQLAVATWSDDVDELLALARDGRVLRAPPAESSIASLPTHRLGEAFEALRDRSDAALARYGARPRVLLARLGPAAQHTARATFAKTLLEAGGIESVASAPLGDVEAAAEAFRASGTAAAAVCSSDDVYADLAVPVARALKAAGCEHIYLMGEPADGLRDELAAAGVDGTVHLGQDVAAFLAGLHDRLGTPAA